MEIEAIVAQIPGATEWETIQALTERGIGPDKKYRIVTKQGQQRLLRLAPGAQIEAKRRIFDLMAQCDAQTQIAMPRPVEVGLSRDENHAYTLLSWVEGRDFEALIPTFSLARQYDFGFESGQILRRLHTATPLEISFETPSGDWQKEIEAELAPLLEWYRAFEFRLPGDDFLLAYIHDNLPLMQGRPQRILHVDYHIGNFILQPDDTLGIIDFDFIGVGDPWRESRWFSYTNGQGHREIANGQLHGYFEGQTPPAEFFPVMAFYAALGIFGSLKWQWERWPNRDPEIYLGGARKRFTEFGEFQNPIPNWVRMP